MTETSFEPDEIGAPGAIGAIESSTATTVTIGGRTLLAFAGCNYLGLAHHPRVVDALAAGLAEHGISCGASRRTTGNSAAHEELEVELSRFLGREAALLAPDGYLANVVVAQALADDHDVALVDERCHASIRDALAAARWRVVEYEHATAPSAAQLLKNERSQRVVLFTDGVFPAQRTIAPLCELLDALPRGSTLVVDDAHATGVLGRSGAGTCEHFGITDPRVVITTTLSKALGCFGGAIIGSRELVRAARERSSAFVCASPIPPAIASAGSAAIRELAGDPSRLARLRANIADLRARFAAIGLPAPEDELPVFPFALESEARMRRVHEHLIELGILAPYIRYPDGMDDRRGYFRVALSAEHTRDDVARLAAALERALSSAITREPTRAAAREPK
jgi:7-keto-8-aminopelargonate synthetase-like enzyme